MRFMDSLRKQPQIGSVTTQFTPASPSGESKSIRRKRWHRACRSGVLQDDEHSARRFLYQQFQPVRKTYQTYIQLRRVPVVTVIRSKANFVGRRSGQLDSRFVVHDRTGYYGCRIRLAVQPLPVDRADGQSRRESFDRSGDGRHRSGGRRRAARGGRNHLERLILSGKDGFG